MRLMKLKPTPSPSRPPNAAVKNIRSALLTSKHALIHDFNTLTDQILHLKRNIDIINISNLSVVVDIEDGYIVPN